MLNKLKTKKFWINAVRDITILVVILYGVNLYQTRNIPTIAPELTGQLITGAQVNLAEMIEKSPVIIYFWGSWCPICQITSPTITDLSNDYQVISIALSSGNKQQIQSYLNENGYNFPVINDNDGFISQSWGVKATPTIFIINTQGEVNSVTMGISSALGLRFRMWMAS
jgi:thiol-disulfide isomerase/thioredoxin